MKAKPSLALSHPQLKAFLTFTCVVREVFSLGLFAAVGNAIVVRMIRGLFSS